MPADPFAQGAVALRRPVLQRGRAVMRAAPPAAASASSATGKSSGAGRPPPAKMISEVSVTLRISRIALGFKPGGSRGKRKASEGGSWQPSRRARANIPQGMGWLKPEEFRAREVRPRADHEHVVGGLRRGAGREADLLPLEQVREALGSNVVHGVLLFFLVRRPLRLRRWGAEKAPLRFAPERGFLKFRSGPFRRAPAEALTTTTTKATEAEAASRASKGRNRSGFGHEDSENEPENNARCQAQVEAAARRFPKRIAAAKTPRLLPDLRQIGLESKRCPRLGTHRPADDPL